MVKNPPAMEEPQETRVQSLGQEDPLEEGMTTHCKARTQVFLPGVSLDRGVHRVEKSQI